MNRTIELPSTRIDPVGGPARRLLFGLVACALLLAACGGDDEIEAGTGGDTTSEGTTTEDTTQEAPDDSATEDPVDTEDLETEDPDKGDDGDDDGADNGDDETTGSLDESASLTQTESHPELISAETAPITSIETVGDQTLAVRFSNGSEPCSLANVIVEETTETITVTLQTGLHPDAASMSCIAQVVDYEIPVELADPVADREIIAVEP